MTGLPSWAWIAGGAALLAGGVYLYLLSGKTSGADEEDLRLRQPMQAGAEYRWTLELAQPVDDLQELTRALERHFDLANVSQDAGGRLVIFEAPATRAERLFPFTLQGVPGKIISAELIRPVVQ